MKKKNLPYQKPNWVLIYGTDYSSTHLDVEITTALLPLKASIDDACNALREGAAVVMSILDYLWAQLTHLSDREKASKANSYVCKCICLAIVKLRKISLKIHSNIPTRLDQSGESQTRLEEVRRPVEAMIGSEVTKPSDITGPTYCSKKGRMEVNGKGWTAPLNYLHKRRWFSTLDIKSTY